VVEVPGFSKWVGERVVGEINLVCGECIHCRHNRPRHCLDRTVLGISGKDGVFADFFTLPAVNLHRVPDSVSDRQAVFTEHWR
jgi:threonine dehydrogenase-like Zn-dependent dehydrogenase